MTAALVLSLFVLLVLTDFFNFSEMALVKARKSALAGEAPALFLAAIRAGDFATDPLIGA
jgi:CBS domain containing-hemolysin-like protein